MDRKLSKLILIAPMSIMYLVLIGGGFLFVLKESVGLIPNLGFDTFTLVYYSDVIGMAYFTKSILISLLTAFVAASLSMLFGTVIAFKMLKTKQVHLKKMGNLLLRIGIVLPYLYMVFLVMLVFSQSGLISRLIHAIGLIEGPNEFPNLIYNTLGIVSTFVLKGIPFVTLLVFNVMSKINRSYDHVAMTLGSESKAIFKRIYLPLSRDTIVWTGMILFAYDLGSFEVPYILSALKSQNFSVKLYSAYLNPSIETIPTTMAMTVLLFVVGLFSVGLFAMAMRAIIRRLHR